MRIVAYCDGAVKNNGRDGRIGMGAVICYYWGQAIISTTSHSWGLDCNPATNNLAELTAIRNAFHVIEGDPKDIYLCVYSDSEWAIKAINGDYRISHHVDLVEEIRHLSGYYDVFQAWWLKGHSGHLYNEKANELAQREAGTWKGKKTHLNGP